MKWILLRMNIKSMDSMLCVKLFLTDKREWLGSFDYGFFKPADFIHLKSEIISSLKHEMGEN